jgi:hypothetical protein
MCHDVPMSTVDLDAQLSDLIADAAKKRKYNKVKLFGKEWRVTTEPNTYAALAGSFGDIEALVAMITNIVHPDEREDFHKTLLQAEDLNADILMQILNGLVEVAGERPTKSSSGSSRSQAKTRAVSRKSAAT